MMEEMSSTLAALLSKSGYDDDSDGNHDNHDNQDNHENHDNHESHDNHGSNDSQENLDQRVLFVSLKRKKITVI